MTVCGVTAFAAAPHTADSPPSPSGNRSVADTVSLGEVHVTASRPSTARVDMNGVLNFGKESLEKAPRMFGESDALQFMKLLPGISAGSDYSSGASIDGMSYAQNEYRLNGIPIHFPYHFGGIFSVLHPKLFENAKIAKSIHQTGNSDVTGGIVDLSSSESQAEKLEGEINAGMIASSVYVRTPAGKRLSVAASARVSYIDALYSSLLKDGSMEASYGFNDVGMVATASLSESDMLQATVHHNSDHVSYDDRDFSLTTALKWHNLLAGLRWIHDGSMLQADNEVYYSRFANTLTLDMQDVVLKAPTSTSELGAKGWFCFQAINQVDLSVGYGLRHYSITPQWIDLTGFGRVEQNKTKESTQSTAGKIWAEARWMPTNRWLITAGTELNGFWGNDRYHSVAADPRISLSLRWKRGNATIHFGRYHQYLHQVGFSDMGMSSNFKLAACRQIPAQESRNIAVALSHHLSGLLSLSFDGYYKSVANDPEYLGAVLDIISPDYRSEDYVKVSRGYNVGFNLMARMNMGNVSAMASYGYCIAHRRFNGEEYFNAANSLRHTLSALASWQVSSRLSISAVMNLASGRPYTPITAIYFIGEKLMMEYGKRNSVRLPLYHRLDLGADYCFRTEGRFPLSHRINLSVLNVYGHRNVEMSTFTVDVTSGQYHRRNVSSLYRLLPSLSYTISF